MPIDLHDLDRAIDEVEGARSAGLFGGVMLPAMSVKSRLPGYADEYYERFWSACEDQGMVINLHTGASGSATDTKYLYDAKHGGMLGLYEVFVFTRRPLWFFVFGGVFDRHPNLRVAITENGVQWLPSLVRDMEQFFDTHGAAPVRSMLRMRPAEYFERHVYLGGSLIQRADAEQREKIGVERLMWGADFPHIEGAAPVHRQVLANVFGGLPKDDLRRILGLNAIELWGFDQDLLQRVADRVGPTVDDLAEPLPLERIPLTFSWSLARPVPLATG
jgi:predicted TIM-barrel fold metal-dependent hydrolase